MTKGGDDNRSNQLNPKNDAYWQSRGYDERPDDWEERSKDDDGWDDDWGEDETFENSESKKERLSVKEKASEFPKENREERIYKIRNKLDSLIKAAGKGSHVLFLNPGTGKFVQFVFPPLLCDIPTRELSKEEEDEIRSIIGEGARSLETGELISHQKVFELNEIDKAVELVERVFIGVLKLPESYLLNYFSSINISPR